ncbi:MAG: RHS repeat domain-containing protein [Bacteroidales bacterium]
MDIYGKVRSFEGDKTFLAFLFQGQTWDEDVQLAYNRFRWYSNDTGTYISQDPIGLLGNNPNLYGYVFDSNTEVDPFGLKLMSVNPNDINFSQRTVSEIRIFDADKYSPIRVMEIDGQLVSYDNRRLLSAQNAELDSLDVKLVKGDDIMPGSKMTWNEAFQKRFNHSKNIEAGGVVPDKGLKEKPNLPKGCK